MNQIKTDENGTIYLCVSWTLKKTGRRVMIIYPGMTVENFKNEPLARAIMKAHQYTKLLETGKFHSVIELAKALKMDRSTLARTLSLVNLAPDVVQAIFNGKAPTELTLEKVSYGFPDDWEEQKKVFGMT